MRSALLDKSKILSSGLGKVISLILIFAVTFSVILIVRASAKKESGYTDDIAEKIAQEMESNQFVLSSKSGRRTAADFKGPIISNHGTEKNLIVHTADLSETVLISKEGLWGLAWTSSYQNVSFEGSAQYTVDLSKLSESDFSVNNETKTLTVKIPYADLSAIIIPPDRIKFEDVHKGGFFAPTDIRMTPEENAELVVKIKERMKAKLIDEDILSDANESAKKVVSELLSATVRSVDPEFTVTVVQ